MLDNITFGLEVCADHGMGRLRKATPLAGDVFVQIQLISSGGMIMFPASVATLKGGLVSNVDGATPQTTNTKSDAAGFHSELYSVLSAGQPSTLRDMREIPLLTSFHGECQPRRGPEGVLAATRQGPQASSSAAFQPSLHYAAQVGGCSTSH